MLISSSNLKGFFYAIISSATFGLIPLLALPVVSHGMDNSSILFYRFFISAILMGIIALFKGSSVRISLRETLFIALLGFFYAATALLLMNAYTLIPSGVATTIHFLYPIMVSFVMILFFNEKKSYVLLLAMLLSLAGVGLLSWSHEGDIKIKGILTALGSIFTYALYIVGIHKGKVKRIDEYALTFYILLFSALFFLMNVSFNDGIQPITDRTSFVYLFLLALLPTVISDLTLVLAIKNIGSTTTSILGSMEPLTAVAIGVIVFNEPFGVKTALGILMILIAVIAVIINNRADVQINH